MAVSVLGAALIAGCGTGPLGSPTLAPLITLGPTFSAPADTPTPTPGTTATAQATGEPWPAGWDDALCAALPELVVAQELARDIGRALAEEDRDDALGLTRELGATVTGVRTLLGDAPEWPGAEELLGAVEAMLGDDEQLVTFYLRYLEDDRAAALDRAHEVEAGLRDATVPAVESALADLAGEGLSCPGTSFELETP